MPASRRGESRAVRRCLQHGKIRDPGQRRVQRTRERYFDTQATETTMRALAIPMLVMLLASCATQAERAAQVEREVDGMVAIYGPGCEKLGYRADSDPWRECVLRLATNERLSRRQFTTTNCVGSRGFFSCSTF